MIGKYVRHYLHREDQSTLTEDALRRAGFV